MNKNKEIEFKTFISKETYDTLLEEFNLANNIFPQTNYYFDTEDTKLMEDQTVLRIRQKGNNFKLFLENLFVALNTITPSGLPRAKDLGQTTAEV